MSRWRNQLSYAPVDVLRILIVCGVESTPFESCLDDTFSAQARRLTPLTA